MHEIPDMLMLITSVLHMPSLNNSAVNCTRVDLVHVDSHELMSRYLLNKAVSLASGKDNLSVYVSGTSSFMVGQYPFKDEIDYSQHPLKSVIRPNKDRVKNKVELKPLI